jgi:hypothetical protein
MSTVGSNQGRVHAAPASPEPGYLGVRRLTAESLLAITLMRLGREAVARNVSQEIRHARYASGWARVRMYGLNRRRWIAT